MPAHHLTVGATVYDTAGATVGTLDRYEPRGSFWWRGAASSSPGTSTFPFMPSGGPTLRGTCGWTCAWGTCRTTAPPIRRC